MFSLQQIETDLVAALKSKDQLTADTLRGLKTRIMNEKIAKMKDLEEGDLFGLLRSEAKRRKEAADSFQKGGRPELAEKELKELAVIEKYLPAQMSEEQVGKAVEEFLAQNSFSAADFGKAMGAMKAKLGDQADSAMIAKILKEKLK
jgi:uncharacterized protein YqeY